MWRSEPVVPADSFYQIRPECAEGVPKTRFKIKAGKTLSQRKWRAEFSPEGQLDIAKVLGRIQRGVTKQKNCIHSQETPSAFCPFSFSPMYQQCIRLMLLLDQGIHPSIRGEVWEFLLGCYDSDSTYEEREQIRLRRRARYVNFKEDCRLLFPLIGSGRYVTAPIISEDGYPTQDPIVLMQTRPEAQNGSTMDASPDQTPDVNVEPIKDKKEIEWKLTLHQIGLDVVRTDRTLVFYEKQENLSRLWDVLAVYAWIDTDVGYCQGMSDLCSPMLMLLEDEGDAFWCFERLMRRLRGNFRCTGSSVGVESQLNNLALITQVIDPKLHQHIEHLGGGDYLFAVRMIMVQFRREFSFCDSLYLWEMMWALEYDPGLFSMYEEQPQPSTSTSTEMSDGPRGGKPKSSRQCGKFERENMRNAGKSSEAPLPISIFLVASVMKDKSDKLLTEARGLDDVVKILNDMTGNLDAKKACTGALKLHKKYMKKVPKQQPIGGGDLNS